MILRKVNGLQERMMPLPNDSQFPMPQGRTTPTTDDLNLVPISFVIIITHELLRFPPALKLYDTCLHRNLFS